MNLNTIVLLLISTIFLNSCADYKTDRTTKKKEKQYYSSMGFALIYSDHHYLNKVVNKKIKNEESVAMHNLLKINTPIMIINPDNSKFIETKIYKKADYPKIFNVVISRKIASFLELDFNNPYVEIIETKKNKTFIAKKSETFEEEKNVSEKAPVDEVKMDDLVKDETKIEKKNVVSKNFILVISDFYFLDSANNLKKELLEKTKMINMSVKKINNKKYRLLVGPFKNFNALKTTYISLNNLGFENLNIYTE